MLVLLPGGTFTMGAQSSDPNGPNYDPRAEGNEGPPHLVTLAPFFLSKYEMTQAQWQRLMGRNPSFFDAGDARVTPRNPVEQVSWHECREAAHRYGLVLPTEAQWEYGARGGTQTAWWCGQETESIDRTRARNLADAFARSNGSTNWSAFESWSDGATVHAEVGSYAPNPIGLYDVIGNPWEWCEDGWTDYSVEPREGDGLRANPVQTGARARVFRGGGFNITAVFARSAFRGRGTPDARDYGLGVRPAMRID